MAAAPRPEPGESIASINVTPMADVMIVLLIIFMVTLPLIHQEPGLRLPAARNAAGAAPEPVELLIRSDGSLALDGAPVAGVDMLAVRLGARLRERPDARLLVQLRADERLAYPVVARVLDACRGAGAERIALLTAPALEAVR